MTGSAAHTEGPAGARQAQPGRSRTQGRRRRRSSPPRPSGARRGHPLDGPRHRARGHPRRPPAHRRRPSRRPPAATGPTARSPGRGGPRGRCSRHLDRRRGHRDLPARTRRVAAVAGTARRGCRTAHAHERRDHRPRRPLLGGQHVLRCRRGSRFPLPGGPRRHGDPRPRRHHGAERAGLHRRRRHHVPGRQRPGSHQALPGRPGHRRTRAPGGVRHRRRRQPRRHGGGRRRRPLGGGVGHRIRTPVSAGRPPRPHAGSARTTARRCVPAGGPPPHHDRPCGTRRAGPLRRRGFHRPSRRTGPADDCLPPRRIGFVPGERS